MTNDSHLFPPRPQWEAKGYRPDEYSRWLLGNWRPIDELWAELGVDSSRPEPAEIELEDWLFDTTAGPERREAEARFVHGHLLKPGDIARTAWQARCAQPPYDALPFARANIPPGIVLSREGDAWIREESVQDITQPFYEGRMIGQFDFSQKGWVSGKGRGAVWRDIPWKGKKVEPQYLMPLADYKSSAKSIGGPSIAYMRVSSSTNSRSTIATYLRDLPTGDSVFHFVPSDDEVRTSIILSAVFSSFAFDAVIRRRLGGLNMSEFVMVEASLPGRNPFMMQIITELMMDIGLVGPLFSRERLQLGQGSHTISQSLTPRRRLERVCVLDSLVALWMGLEIGDLRFLLADCSTPSPLIPKLKANPKGFWRIDKNKNPELRQTVLTLIAFHDLQDKIESVGGNQEEGITAFLAQNHSEGWMLPETLRLADYRLGHDERAKQPQPVAICLGPRFYDWQLAQSPEESWRECYIHARNLLGEHGYGQLLAKLGGEGLLEEPLPHRYGPPETLPTAQPLLKVAEPTAGYRSDMPSQDGQSELFE